MEEYTAVMNQAATLLAEELVRENKQNIIRRLRRIEGQVRGLQKMVETERDCHEILTLFAGARRALDAASDVILETYLTECACGSPDGQLDIEELLRAVKLARG
jgi:DNA-binding FrmR family transcriptional regulator